MPIVHLFTLWFIVLAAAAITVGLIAGYGAPVLIVTLIAAVGLHLWNARK